MKKLFFLVLIGLLALTLCACVVDDTPADTTAEDTPAPTEAPTAEPTEAPTETPTEPAKGGCKSSVGLSALLLVGGAVLTLRKKREE